MGKTVKIEGVNGGFGFRHFCGNSREFFDKYPIDKLRRQVSESCLSAFVGPKGTGRLDWVKNRMLTHRGSVAVGPDSGKFCVRTIWPMLHILWFLYILKLQ